MVVGLKFTAGTGAAIAAGAVIAAMLAISPATAPDLIGHLATDSVSSIIATGMALTGTLLAIHVRNHRCGATRKRPRTENTRPQRTTRFHFEARLDLLTNRK
ncbi:hypothetical protein [Actinokineospora pegani]|uniref:hypothetical protein n=1 Tax=Actinokineospora pegani TaxID=2654637 RepID=UPI0012EA5640|nr:hypothetical protein [Actinokineospora pegani]